MSAGLLSDRIFGEASDGDLRNDSLAFGEFSDAGPYSLNRAGDLEARRKRQRGFELILPGNDQQVWKVQPRRINSYQDLVVTGLGLIDLIDRSQGHAGRTTRAHG